MNPASWGGLAHEERSKHGRKSRELGAHVLNLKQETKKELEVCGGALKARLQWRTSSSWDLSPKLPQSALLARNQVFKYGSIWVHSYSNYSNQYKQYKLNHYSFSFRYFARFFNSIEFVLFCINIIILICGEADMHESQRTFRGQRKVHIFSPSTVQVPVTKFKWSNLYYPWVLLALKPYYKGEKLIHNF